MAKVIFEYEEKLLEVYQDTIDVPDEIIAEGKKALRDYVQENIDFDYHQKMHDDILDQSITSIEVIPPEEVTLEEKEKAYFKDPTKCPSCGSDDIHACSSDVDNNKVTARMECPDCGTNWTNEYLLNGVTNLID